MTRRLLDLWYDVRPFLGHALMGMGIGCMGTTVLIALVASNFGVTGDVFLALTIWVLSLFVAGVSLGAVGILLYMSPYDRKEWHARHALRPADVR